jgi:hypothetical protein
MHYIAAMGTGEDIAYDYSMLECIKSMLATARASIAQSIGFKSVHWQSIKD